MMDEKDLNNKIYDYKNGEVVDFLSGEVEEDHLLVSKPTIRASDYAEWESKKQHEVYFSEADKRLWVPIWNVGEMIGAPKWLRNEVFWFYKKARALKTRPEFKGKGIYVSDRKYILAVYYVVAKKRGLTALAEQIASMPCNERGEPCYVNRKRGDPKFKKYLKIVLRYASRIYPNSVRDPASVLDQLASSMHIPLPESVFRRAKEIVLRIQPNIGGRKTNTVVAAAIKLALDELFPDSSNTYFKIICKQLNVSQLAVKSLLKSLHKKQLFLPSIT